MKLNFRFICVCLLGFMLISCSNQMEKSSVAFKMPVLFSDNEETSDNQNVNVEVNYTVKLTNDADYSEEKNALPGEVVTFSNLVPGEYNILIEAYISDYPEPSYIGRESVTVVAGEVSKVKITLEATGYEPENPDNPEIPEDPETPEIEPADTIQDEVLEEYTELVFTLDKGDPSVGRKPRYRATIDIDNELAKKNITLGAGDTVVITLTGITSADLNELTTQLVQKDDEGEYENFTDTYGRYTQLSFKADSEINLKAPLNFITIPEGCTDYNAVQFFYDAESQDSPETGAVISEAEVSLCVYPAESKTLEFGKDYGYDAQGNKDPSIYRDDITLALAAEDKLNQLTQSNNLKYGDKVSVTVSGTSSKDVELFCYLIDGSEQAEWYRALNTKQPALKLEAGKAFEETIVFDVTQSAAGTGSFKIQFFNDSSKTATEDGNVSVDSPDGSSDPIEKNEEEVTLTSKMTITNFKLETKGINLSETE